MDLRILRETPPWEWPRGADKEFLNLLRDGQADVSERELAAELAGDFTVINDELAHALVSIANSGEEPESLRARAVLSLGPVTEQASMHEFDDDTIPITEDTFRAIQRSLQKLHTDSDTPKEVRRRALEASVRSPEDWHRSAIAEAYSSGDESWRLTAVFCMRFVGGFDEQILEALESGNREIHYEAVCAAGDREIDAAWSHVSGLASPRQRDKSLLLAAIDSVALIRPHEAQQILFALTETDDEDIVEAAFEAIAMSEISLEDFDDEEGTEDDGYLH